MPPRSSATGSALLVGAGAVVLYVATLSRHPTADSLLLALAIESGDPTVGIDWRHPLLDALTRGFVALWERFGWTGGALPPLQVLNALAGAACVALVHHIAARLTGSPRIAAAVAAGFAVSGGTWLLSTEAEFVTLPLAAGLLVLDRVLALTDTQWDRPAVRLALGLAIAAATILYLTNAALLPVALLAARPVAGAVHGWVRRAAGIVTGALLPMAAAIVLFSPGRIAPLEWAAAFDRFAARQGYGRLSWLNLPHGAYAFLRSLLLYPGLGMNDSTREFLAAASRPDRSGFAAYYAVAAGVAAVAPVGAAMRWRVLRAAYGRSAQLLVLWAAQHAAFALFWVAGDFSFWMPVLTVWWLIVAMLVATAEPRRRRAVAAVAVAAAALLLVNGVAFILPRHDLRTNRQHAIAAGVARCTAPVDVVVTHYDDLLALYLRYFAQRTVVIADRDLSDAVATALAQASQSGGRVFVVDVAVPAHAAPFTAVPRDAIAGSPVWEAMPRR